MRFDNKSGPGLVTSNRKLYAKGAALACVTLTGTVTAAPAFKVLYHERLDIAARIGSRGEQGVSFDAYGRHFDIDLEPNDNIAQAVPADRSDIKPYRGTVAGQAGSWVRLTQTRDGWRGIVNDGHDLYAIEPADEMKATAVQPLPDAGATSTPVMYRLADAIMTGAGVCGTDIAGAAAPLSGTGRTTALKAFTRVATDLSLKDTTGVATRQLVVGVVADHTFTDAIGPDPAGAIVARWDIVDGIWSSQVGIKIRLAPLTIMTDTDDRFSTTTVATDLLQEVAGYRAGLSAHQGTGLTHLLTGRALDGNVIGIAYLGAICGGAQAVSLSQSTISLTMGALIAAHELGHSFNAVHDGVPGVCASSPQGYLMAPVINFSNQFSACSLQSINARAATASCVGQIAPVISPDPPPTGGSGSGGADGAGGVIVSDPAPNGDSGTNSGSGAGASSTSGTGGGGGLDLGWLMFLGSMLTLRRAWTLLPRQDLAWTIADETRIPHQEECRAHDRSGCARGTGFISARVASRRRSY
jgi:hypothetical protein